MLVAEAGAVATALEAEAAAKAAAVGVAGWCSPRHQTHFEPSRIELNGIP
jgi:ethanolamine utilization microcompartment shell protein EutL